MFPWFPPLLVGSSWGVYFGLLSGCFYRSILPHRSLVSFLRGWPSGLPRPLPPVLGFGIGLKGQSISPFMLPTVFLGTRGDYWFGDRRPGCDLLLHAFIKHSINGSIERFLVIKMLRDHRRHLSHRVPHLQQALRFLSDKFLSPGTHASCSFLGPGSGAHVGSGAHASKIFFEARLATTRSVPGRKF
eukprot:Blabericola_migrator_1__8739@NODE_45_length_16846_cov_82_345015_g41_i0_p9_GENE_NODE_45_length_16846_cov_82_345015_g41_i0NODE_45_length_16846_cov_82_345015_g41_i0_p9_ORF_typecomplete_len187_score9_90Urb2/PF10441_9/0_016_NODE_45_length_16846_cov_82_345015_g41_i085969156